MNFYASPEYLEVLAQVYFKGRRTRVADVRIGDDVLRLLQVDNKRLITNALFLDYHEPLREEEIHNATDQSGYAEFVVRRVIESAEWDPAVFPGFELAPYVDWSKFPTYDDYKTFLLTRQKGLVRERERRGRRLAEKVGELVFSMDDTQEDVLELAGQWKSRQLRETGLRDYFSDPKTAEYLGLLRQKGLLTSSTLRAKGRLLSAWIGFVYDGVWSGWIFTYDPELAKYSVGHQLLSAMLEESYRRKHREFDFSTGAESYKMPYATHGRLLGPVGRPPLQQRILARVKDEAKTRNPKLFEMARSFKRALDKRSLADLGSQEARAAVAAVLDRIRARPPSTDASGKSDDRSRGQE